ncbi:hypothetical protein NB709_003078 [Xanthomonas sacchari]|nr:hypothetical protein [Xanthomonas sacchari]
MERSKVVHADRVQSALALLASLIDLEHWGLAPRSSSRGCWISLSVLGLILEGDISGILVVGEQGFEIGFPGVTQLNASELLCKRTDGEYSLCFILTSLCDGFLQLPD